MPQFDSEIVPIYRDFMKLKIFMFWAAIVLILPSGPRVSAEPFPSIVKVAYEGYLGPLYLLSAAVEISMDDGSIELLLTLRLRVSRIGFFTFKTKRFRKVGAEIVGLFPYLSV